MTYFTPSPPRPTFDLFLTYFNSFGVSGPLARPQLQKTYATENNCACHPTPPELRGRSLEISRRHYQRELRGFLCAVLPPLLMSLMPTSDAVKVDTEYDRANVPPYNGNDPPPAPGSLKRSLFPTLLNEVQNKGTQGVRARYGAELPPIISIVRYPGRPVISVPEKGSRAGEPQSPQRVRHEVRKESKNAASDSFWTLFGLRGALFGTLGLPGAGHPFGLFWGSGPEGPRRSLCLVGAFPRKSCKNLFMRFLAYWFVRL